MKKNKIVEAYMILNRYDEDDKRGCTEIEVHAKYSDDVKEFEIVGRKKIGKQIITGNPPVVWNEVMILLDKVQFGEIEYDTRNGVELKTIKNNGVYLD